MEKPEHKKKMVVVEEESPVVEPVVEASIQPVETPVVSAPQPVEVVEPVYDEEPKTNYLFIIVPVALLVGALVGGLITYFSGLSRLGEAEKTPSPVPVVVETEATPQASPSSTLKRDELKVQVLNGSGVSGAAGKAKSLLESLGYKNVEVGNASVSNLAQTEVAILDTKKEFLDMIIKDLSANYEAVGASKPLATTSKFDLVITIGKK